MIRIVRLVENMYLLVHCPFGKFDLGHAFKTDQFATSNPWFRSLLKDLLTMSLVPCNANVLCRALEEISELVK